MQARPSLSSRLERLGDCPLAPAPHASPILRLRHALTHFFIPAFRAYIRYAPRALAKQALWDRLVGPRLAWHQHRFVGRARFGARISGQTTEILQQYVYYFGLWEPAITRCIAARLQPGDVFVDVGANIGYYTLLAARRVGEAGAVVAVEPARRLFLELEENLRRNRVQNVRCVRAAASNRDHQMVVVPGPDDHTGLTRVVTKPRSEHDELVPARPLDRILEDHELERVRLLKIDVEGAEGAVVAGMTSLLDSPPPELEVLVELHPELLADQGGSVGDIIGHFRSTGFHAFVFENDYTPEALIGTRPPRDPECLREPIDYECNVLFTRQARP